SARRAGPLEILVQSPPDRYPIAPMKQLHLLLSAFALCALIFAGCGSDESVEQPPTDPVTSPTDGTTPPEATPTTTPNPEEPGMPEEPPPPVETAKGCVEKGLAKQQTGDLDGAIEAYMRAIELDAN